MGGCVNSFTSVIVEAKNSDEAEDKAWDVYCDVGGEWEVDNVVPDDIEVCDWEEVTEDEE